MNEHEANTRGSASGRNDAATGASADLASLFNYPSLGKLFEGQTADAALADMRTRLARTNQDLERVIRSSDHQRQRNNEAFTRLLDDADNSALDENQRTRARAELSRAASMLDLLDDLLAMQDYTLSQMGTFSQG